MYVRCRLACVLQGAALLLLLHLAPRGALGAAACGAGAELTCADRGREEHDADEEALIQVRPSGRDEDMPDAVNSTIKSAVDKANETLRSAMEAVNGALDWLTDAMNANKSSSSSGAAAVEEAEPANATADELTNASDASEAQPPRACCAAVTAKCLACLLNVSVEEYCQSDPHSVGCGDEAGAGGALGAAPCGGEEPCGAAAEGSKIAPFGNEEMAARLEEQAGKTQDALVEALETAQVAEIKRAVFRSLTRLRAAQIKEFDTIARLETQALDEYNDKHHYLAENPLEHIGTGEQDPSLDKYTSFHD